MSKKEGNGVDDIVVDRSCIECDNCGVGSPQKRCGRCGSYYYCSKECQAQHWKHHKQTCTMIKESYDDWEEDRNKTLPDGNAFDTKEGPCAICLEETITNPVVLQCGHAFCFSCVGKYQWASESGEASCPYCRGEIPDVMEKAWEREKIYRNRAFTSPEGSEEQKKYAKLALAEFDSSFDLLEQVEDVSVEDRLHDLYIRSTMMARADMPEETINLTKEVLSLVDKYPGVLDRHDVQAMKQYLAEAYSAVGKWIYAGSIYLSLIDENVLHESTSCPIAIAKGFSRAMYETGKYDQAINVGTVAIKANRGRSGVHKYVALSQKAKGDIEEAKKTMFRAILYEEHWDKDNSQQNKQILKELNDL